MSETKHQYNERMRNYQRKRREQKAFDAIQAGNACQLSLLEIIEKKEKRKCQMRAAFLKRHVPKVKPPKQTYAEKLARKQVYRKELRLTNQEFRLFEILRARMNKFIKLSKQGSTTHHTKHLPYTTSELKTHIESLWLPGMSWENHGIYKRGGQITWHIDHVRPLASFPKDTPLSEICALSNLRPLWAIENMQKAAKWSA